MLAAFSLGTCLTTLLCFYTYVEKKHLTHPCLTQLRLMALLCVVAADVMLAISVGWMILGSEFSAAVAFLAVAALITLYVSLQRRRELIHS